MAILKLSLEDIMSARRKISRLAVFSALVGVFGLGCGQDPSFMNLHGKKKNSSDAEEAPDLDGEVLVDEESNGGAGDEILVEGSGDPEEVDAGDGDDMVVEPLPPEDYDIPEADDDDLDALHKCMAQWKNLPFDQTINSYKKISAAVTVGGYGNAVNDTEATDTPQLVLISAGVNVLGAPTYKLLNPNGYYCIKVNVNVQTDLTVELHCNARLSDGKVNVNVQSNQNDVTSAVGVHVLSEVEVVTIRPNGDQCIR